MNDIEVHILVNDIVITEELRLLLEGKVADTVEKVFNNRVSFSVDTYKNIS